MKKVFQIKKFNNVENRPNKFQFAKRQANPLSENKGMAAPPPEGPAPLGNAPVDG